MSHKEMLKFGDTYFEKHNFLTSKKEIDINNVIENIDIYLTNNLLGKHVGNILLVMGISSIMRQSLYFSSYPN